MKDLTIMVSVDDAHLTELTYSFRTWNKFHPQFFSEHPYCIIYDVSQLKDTDSRFNMFKGLKYEMFPWDNFYGIYKDQREKMLTSLIVAPSEYIKTKWYLKIDTDTIATRNDEWFEEEWFKDSENIFEENMFISNPWGYTKPPNAIDVMDEWSDKFPDVKNYYPRLNIHPKEGSDCVSHNRIISWLMFARTEWTKLAASYAKNWTQWMPSNFKNCTNTYKLPVPSQDTYLIYFAQRMKFNYKTIRFKKFGWDHMRLKNIKRKCLEIFGG